MPEVGNLRMPLYQIRIKISPNLFYQEGNGSPLQYSCLENPTDRGAWWAAVPGAARVRHNCPTRTHTRPSTLILWNGCSPFEWDLLSDPIPALCSALHCPCRTQLLRLPEHLPSGVGLANGSQGQETGR